jgi:hypothetical protein
MNNKTRSYIKQTTGNANFSLVMDSIMIKAPYILIIESHFKEFIRIMIYPLNRTEIVMLSLMDLSPEKEDLHIVTTTLKPFEIIHSSGIMKIDDQLIADFYLNISKSDERYKDLIKAANMIKNVCKNIEIKTLSVM